MTPDLVLLMDYAQHRIQALFTALVDRHLDRVFIMQGSKMTWSVTKDRQGPFKGYQMQLMGHFFLEDLLALTIALQPLMADSKGRGKIYGQDMQILGIIPQVFTQQEVKKSTACLMQRTFEMFAVSLGLN